MIQDARILNWRFVVPDEAHGILLLPASDETLDGAVMPERSPAGLRKALAAGPYPGVAVPDVGSWTGRSFPKPAELIETLSASVAAGGWLYAGFANVLYPGRPARPGALRLGAALHAMRRAGLDPVAVYLALPDQRCPAYLVPTRRGTELDFFLRNLFFPYAGPNGNGGVRARQSILRLMRRMALLSPPGLRLQVGPAFAVVAGRSS